jgi:hypothetical protein
MARTILVIGESGSGKTTSIRNLDYKTTFVFDCDRKGLSFKSWKKFYNVENKNYLATSNIDSIWACLKRINNQDLTHIKTVIIDTLNGIMIDDEFKRMNEKNYDKWQDLAASIYGLVTNINDLREDLTVVCMAHSQTERDDSGYAFTRMKTSGKKLDKICVESKFTTVLLAKVENGSYLFETHANHSTAKTPMGLFEEKTIPNDIVKVIDALKEYEEG